MLGFFHYIVFTALFPDQFQCIKLGITVRAIWYRLKSYLTGDSRREYFSVVEFYGPGMTSERLLKLEKIILYRTKQYIKNAEDYASECRFNVSAEVIYQICLSCYEDFCKKHENIFYKQVDIKEALLVRDEDTEDIKREDKKYQKHEYFKSFEDLQTSIDLPQFKGYQTEAFARLVEAFNNRFSIMKFAALLNIMCGYGKTILIQAFACMFANEFRCIVYCTERLALIEDQINRFSGIRDRGFSPIELSSSGSKYCRTDAEFASLIRSNGKFIIFVAHKSFHRLAPLLQQENRILFIFDEAHNLCREPSEAHPLIILNKLRVPKKVDDFTIYSTATKINGVLTPDNTRIYMNDPTYFNVTNIQYTDIKRGIDEQFICPFKLVVRTNVTNICEQLEGQKEQISMSITDRSLLINCINVLCSLFLDVTLARPPRKVVIYTNRTSRIEAIFAALTYLISVVPGLQDIKLYKLYSKSDRGDLKKFMDEKERCIMINCRILTEGIDCKDIDTIVFCDPKHSEQDIIQCIFRGCRFLLGKIAYIVFPVDENTFMTDNKLSTFRTTIKALIKYNDPNVTREMLSRSKHELTSGNQEFVKNEMFAGHFIDESIKHKILDVFSADFIIDDLKGAVKYVLSYKSFITAKEIYKEINEQKLWSVKGETPENTISARCGEYYKSGIIGCIKDSRDGLLKYYELAKPKVPIITTKTFIEELKDQDIFTEVDYREKYSSKYDDIFVFNPVSYYPNFNWDLVYDDSKNEYETFELCECRIKQIITFDEFKKQIIGVIGNDKIWNVLMKYDNRIPSHPKKYNTSYDQFGPLFNSWARR